MMSQRLAALMVVAFVNTLGEFMVLALLPFYAEPLGASPFAVGVLVSAFHVAAMATAPLWGRLADRSGRRPALLLALLVSAVGYALFGLAGSLEVLMLGRVAQGIGGGSVPVVFAYIADSVSGERRAEGIGWVTAVTSSAAMIGPAVGSLVGGLHLAAPGIVLAVLSLATARFAQVWLPESRPTAPAEADLERDGLEQGESEQADSDAEPFSILGAVVRVAVQPLRQLHLLIWIYGAGMVGMTGMTAIIGLYLAGRFGVDASNIWWFFAALGGLSIAFRVLVLGRAVRRFGEIAVLRTGAISFGAGLIAIPFAPGPLALGAAVFCVSLGTSLLFPCTTSQVSRRAPGSNLVGQVLGVQQAYGNAGKVLTPLVVGYLFEELSAAAPFLIIGAVVAAAAALSFRLR